ncbi:hypothetical protein E0H73_17375 [Kribbella pittospori]|uniref:Uncharacterized protein n=1 Tax=Kribbella pittospori TaxID=722689 RepID=A0A4R0KS43_9ACTN|nr:hypothetical protein [Kribbella pittospori]TCC61028.1 hypothetical protein E0H73_17375 [Kribbella pittospori]
MSTDLEQLMIQAADDTDHPLQTSVEDIVRRGRRTTRITRAATVGTTLLTTAAVVAGITAWTAHRGGSAQPAGAPGVGVALQPAASTLTDAQIISRCGPLDDQWQLGHHKAGGGTGTIAGWKVAVSQAAGTWIRAILVSPDKKRWAICQQNSGAGTPRDNYLREDLKYQEPFVNWTDSDGTEGPVPANVASVDIEIDGVTSEATVKNGFMLWYADLDPRKVADKPIWAIYYDKTGREIARFDSNDYNPYEGEKPRRKPIYPK